MRPLTLLVVLLSLPLYCYPQLGLEKYFDYDLFPTANFNTYKEIPVTWNFDGATQREFNAGLTALTDEKYAQAIFSFDEAVTLNPTLWISYYYRGICKKATGQLEDALKDLEFSREKSGGKFEISYEIGEVYQAKLDFKNALKYFEESRDLAPDQVEGYYGIANIAFLRLDPERAVRFYKKCMDVNPSFPDAYLKAGLLKLFVNRRENKALEYLDKALAVNPDFADGLYWRGLINTEFNNYDKALQDWNRLIQLNANRPTYTLVRGYLYIELNNFEKAFTDLKNAMIAFDIDENKFQLGSSVLNKQIDLQSASHYLMRNIFGLSDEAASPLKKAYCLMIKKNYKVALHELNNSLKVERSSSAHLLKATAFEHINNHDSAYYHVNAALKLDNDIFDAHKKRAIYRTALKDWRGANLDFLEMERLQPETFVTYRLRGQLKSNLKDYYGAVIDLTRYLKSDSLNREVLKLRANAQFQIGNYNLYKNDFVTLARIDTANLEYRQSLYVANILLNDTIQAEAVLEACEKDFPEASFPILQHMEIHLWKKDWDKAILWYSNFNNLPYRSATDRSEALYLKGLAHLGKLENELAMKCFEQSIAEGKPVSFVNLDAHYERGKLHLKNGKTKQTKADFKILKANNYSKDKELIETVLNSD